MREGACETCLETSPRFVDGRETRNRITKILAVVATRIIKLAHTSYSLELPPTSSGYRGAPLVAQGGPRCPSFSPVSRGRAYGGAFLKKAVRRPPSSAFTDQAAVIARTLWAAGAISRAIAGASYFLRSEAGKVAVGN